MRNRNFFFQGMQRTFLHGHCPNGSRQVADVIVHTHSGPEHTGHRLPPLLSPQKHHRPQDRLSLLPPLRAALHAGNSRICRGGGVQTGLRLRMRAGALGCV